MDTRMSSNVNRTFSFANNTRQVRQSCELKLETTPRNAQYSQRVTDLMRREEAALREGIEATEIFHGVDSLITSETRNIFAKITEQNCKKWNTFIKNTDGTCKRFVDEMRAVLRGSPDSVTVIGGSATHMSAGEELERAAIERLRMSVHGSSGGGGSSSTSVGTPLGEETPAGLQAPVQLSTAVEQMRLEQYYNKHWLDVEGFHLDEAFKSQEQKIEIEWATHEEDVTKELMARRAQFGVTDKNFGGGADGSGTGASTSPGRWQPAEKQKSLIHTAPVLSPVRRGANGGMSGGGGGSSGSSGARNDPALMEQLLRLEREHGVMMESLKQQRLAATRWMTRQQVRLMAQAVEMQNERRLIASVIERDLRVLSEVLAMMPKH